MTHYVVITPVRDEEKYIEKVIQSMVCQTIIPMQWIIVDDGSQDKTGAIIDSHKAKHPWITVLHRPNRGFRKAGGGVVEAFYDGYAAIKDNSYEYIVKLDGDLTFEPDYFEKCFAEFRNTAKLGVGGGTVYNWVDGKLRMETSPRFHVRGATKIYTRECWDAIGGLIQAPGWDTLDELKANMKGFTTQSFEEIPLVHYRPDGAADGTWRNCVKFGRANYISGYHPLFTILKCIIRAFRKPYLIMGIAILWGFVSGYLFRAMRIEDDELKRYIRKEQMRRLFLRKSIWV